MQGLAACTLCDPRSVPDPTAKTCRCNAGFYAVEWEPSTSYCHRCPDGFACTEQGVTLSTLMIRVGFWFDRSYLASFPPGYGWANLPPALRCTFQVNCNGGQLLPTVTVNSPAPVVLAVAQGASSSSGAGSVAALLGASDRALSAAAARAFGAPAAAQQLDANSTTPTSLCTTAPLALGAPPAASIQCSIQAAPPVCPTGSYGPLCGICQLGYQKDSTNSCAACPSNNNTIVYFSLATAGIVVALGVMVWLLLRTSSKLMKQEQARDRARLEAELGDWNVSAESLVNDANSTSLTRIGTDGELIVPPDFTYKMKIVLSFAQIGSSITAGITIAWPRRLQSFLNALQFANLDFISASSVDCVRPTDFYTRFLAMTSLPIAVMVLVYVFYLLPKKLGFGFRDSDELAAKRSRRRFWKISTFFLFLIYPSVSASVLGIFNCQRFLGSQERPEGLYLLKSDLTKSCESTEHTYYMYAGIALVLLYPLGIPAFLLHKVHQYRHPKDGRGSRLNEPGVMAELGFLYDGARFFLVISVLTAASFCCSVTRHAFLSLIFSTCFMHALITSRSLQSRPVVFRAR